MAKISKALLVSIIGLVSVIVIVLIYVITSNNSQNHEPAVKADNLQIGTRPNKVEPAVMSDTFIRATADFSVDLFKQTIMKGVNSLISPTSVYLALGMTANGAEGQTLQQFESLLGKGSLTIDELNPLYYSLASNLQTVETGKMKITNSIWYRDDESLRIEEPFIQTNADYYGASTYKADFNSKQTVADINNWVRAKTDGLIDTIVDRIDAHTIMYLINTVLFDAEWDQIYREDQIHQRTFSLDDGSNVSVDFMHSDEFGYLKDEQGQGFVKPYRRESPYSFVAMLPNKGVDLQDYVQSLTGEKWLKLMGSKSGKVVATGIPRFKYAYDVSLVDPLKTMGLTDAFDELKANFNRMGHSDKGELFIGNVLHKTFIQVDERGTKAGAATKVEATVTGAMIDQQSVILDRPFLYAIIDNKTNLPIFMGTVNNPAL